MSTDEKLALLRDLYARYHALDAALKPLHDLKVSPESPLIEEPWRAFEFASQQVAERIGDTAHHWLAWFIYENDWGRKALAAGPTGATRPICKFEELLWVMEVSA